MLFSHIKQQERFTFTLNIVMIVLVMISLGLTIIESVESLMTPQLRSIFLSIHISILAAFLAEFLYRFWFAPDLYPSLSPTKARMRFLVHPLTIIDIIVIAPLLSMIFTHNLHDADGVILRVLRFTTLLNMFHFYRSSRVLQLIRDMSREIWFELMVIFIVSVQCILLSGVLFYSIEHGINKNVHNIFDGIWWSVVTLTTIGYGDIYPMTFLGRLLGILLALAGIGLVALPTGILTTGFIRALRSEKKISKLVDALEDEEKEQDEILKRVKKIEEEIEFPDKRRS